MGVHHLHFRPRCEPDLDMHLGLSPDEQEIEINRLEGEMRLRRLVRGLAVKRPLGRSYDTVWKTCEEMLVRRRGLIRNVQDAVALSHGLADVLLAGSRGGECEEAIELSCGRTLTVSITAGGDVAMVVNQPGA